MQRPTGDPGAAFVGECKASAIWAPAHRSRAGGGTICTFGESLNENASVSEADASRRRLVAVRRFGIAWACVGLVAAMPGVFQSPAFAASPAPPFTECPAVGYNTSCSLLVNVTATGTQILKDPGATISSDPAPGTYDGVEDTLIGIINNTGASISHETFSSNSQPLFGFDGDGICQDRNSTSGLPGLGGTGSTVPHCGTVRTGSSPYFNWCNSHDSTCYGGPDAFFTNISRDFKTGTVNFATPIPPGGTDYFSLEEKLDIPDFCQDTITLTPSSATSVVGGGAQTFTATILDEGTPASGIPVTFSVSAGPNTGASHVVNTDANGQAQFNDPSSSVAGADTVQASYHDPTCTSPPTHSAVPSTMTWTKASPSIATQAGPTSSTVGTATTIGDTATFQNTSSVAPTGSVTFTLYSDNTCTTPAGISGSGAISTSNGVSSASFSTAWTPTATGTYYWRASYPGDLANNSFTTTCGAANEVVAITPGSPTLTTQAGPVSITVGIGADGG